ncbi:MAG: tetratricopeptide repeat protein [FCB group bacterium]|nr:tetratricopeptide repeat protein [FCB group bacterium]
MDKIMNELTKHIASDNIRAGIENGGTLLDLARGWLKQGNPVVAIELLKSAIGSVEAERDKVLRAEIIKSLGRAWMMQSDWDNSDFHYLEAQRLFLEMKHYKGASECARNRANMQFQKGNYDQSESLCEQALDWASEAADYELRATILNTLGAIKSATGDFRESIKIFKLCLADFRSTGNLIRQGYVLLNIGLTQTELSEYVEAVDSLEQSLAIALDSKDLHLVEICYQNISKSHLARKEIHLAKSVIDTARKILPGLNSKALETELNLIDCRILRAMGDIESAQGLLDCTYRMAVENKQQALQADLLYEQGLLEKDRGHTELAIAKLDAAVSQYRQIGMEKGFKEAVDLLSRLKGSVNV